MSRWFRFYEESLNDPKLLRLSDGLYRAWTMLLCFASKNDGILPAADDIAAALRTKPEKVSAWIKKLVEGELLDEVDGHYEPHNWSKRQYKTDTTDPTAPQRMKRYRSNKRNDRNATVTVIRPDTEQIQTTETEKQDAAPSGAQIVSIVTPEKAFFDQAEQVLGGGGRSLAAKLLKAKDQSVALAHSALLTASTKSNPREYLGAIIRGRDGEGKSQWAF